MIKNLYCPNCGGKNPYEFKKPNFCTSCGNKFAHASLSQTPTPKKVVEEVNDDEEEYEEETKSFNTSSPLAFSFDIGTNASYTIKSLSTIKDPIVEKGSASKLTKKEIKKNLKDLQDKVREKRVVDLG